MSYPPTPRFPEQFTTGDPELDKTLNIVLQLMWNDLIKPYNQPGLIPYAICLPIADQPSALNYPEGALFFSTDSHHLFVDSYVSGTPTWTQVV